jgi:hypothetical protein
MKCEHTITDYQYATWHKCRACGAMLQRVEAVSGRTELRDIQVPMTMLNFPARPHARGAGIDYE